MHSQHPSVPDLGTLAQRLDAVARDVAFLVERQRRQEELFAELTPIAREAMATATRRLDALEKDGTIAFARELAQVGRRIVASYSADDVRGLGDAITTILDTVRDVTQPSVLAIADEASRTLQHADAVEPIGLVGMVRASRSEEVQKGLAVLMDVLRHVGRAASAVAKVRAGDAPASRKAAQLAAFTAPRAGKSKRLGIERPPPRAAAPAAPAPRSRAPEPAAVIDGLAFGADGHLADPKAWRRDVASTLAAAQNVTLDDARWKVIDFARADWEATGASPNIRRITQGLGLSTKDLYALFPKAPARTVAKIAGIPKPAGCI